MKFLLIFLFFGNLALAQNSSETIFSTTSLFPEQSLELEGKTIKFKKVISDSRCPSDVTCIRAGEAKVLLEVFQDNRLVGEEILIVGGSYAERVMAEFNINLKPLALMPCLLYTSPSPRDRG
jgi:hypothetical protein